MTERWANVRGYERLYSVSDQGRIRGTRGIMQDYDNGNGYRKIRLWSDGTCRAFFVHRLVADAFCLRQAGCDVVNHIDFDRGNNNAENLEWCTVQQNARHSAPHHRKPKSFTHTNTGERYITFRESRRNFRVTIRGREIGRYRTLEDAIRARDFALRG